MGLYDPQHYHNYEILHVSNPMPTNVEKLKDCGCCEVNEDRTPDTVYCSYRVTHTKRYLCLEHMSEYKETLELRTKELQKQQEIDVENENKWLEICDTTRPVATQEKQKLVQFLCDLKIKRLRDFPKLELWHPSFHRGYIKLRFIAKHFSVCPAQEVERIIHRDRDCECFQSIKHCLFRYCQDKRSRLYKFEMY